MKDKKIVIIGAGPGGLVSAMLLARRGFKVEVFEKNTTPGGRNGCLKLGGYKFDIGPTFFMMDNIIRDIFKAVDKNIDDYVKLTKLDPMYRLYFGDDSQIEISSNKAKMFNELKRVFPGNENGLGKFYNQEEKRLKRLFPILSSHNNNIFDILRLRFFLALPHFSIGKTLFETMGGYFKDEMTKLSFTFQSKYLGMSPWECPGAFAMVPYIEHSTGVWHIEGGLSALNDQMAKLVEEFGGKINYNSPVASLMFDNKNKKKVIGVKLSDGKEVLADKVITNADFGYAMTNLVPAGKLKKWSEKRLSKKKLSCSIFMMYLGVKGSTNLDHHSIVFARDYRQNVNDIFNSKLTDKDFSFYIRDASSTDKTLAPKGKSALYILVPVPNNRSDINWEEVTPKLRKQIFLALKERLGLDGLEKAVEEEKIITPADWETDFNVYRGAVFNLAHNLFQMLWFRPHNKFEEFKNLYLVGGGTHPGSGLPTIYESGRIVANLITKKFKK